MPPTAAIRLLGRDTKTISAPLAQIPVDADIIDVDTRVYGQFKNGTGQVFDQANGTSYSLGDGKLVGTTTPDPGKVTPDDELLFNAVTIAVGVPEAAAALKAGGEASIEGLNALFGREVFAEASGITGENLLPKAVAAAELRADSASANLGHPCHRSPSIRSHQPPPIDRFRPAAASMRPHRTVSITSRSILAVLERGIMSSTILRRTRITQSTTSTTTPPTTSTE